MQELFTAYHMKGCMLRMRYLCSPCEKVISKAVKRKNPQHEVLGIYRLLGAWK